MKAKLAASFLAIILFVSAFAVFPFADAGKGIRVVGSMKDDGRILILVQNASEHDLQYLLIESYSGTIKPRNLDRSWDTTVSSISIDAPVKSKNSMRTYIELKDDATEFRLKFKWIGYSSDSSEIAKGAFTVKNTRVEESGSDTSQPVTGSGTPLPGPSLAEEFKKTCKGTAACFIASVTNIVDGDTIDVNDGVNTVRIRLALTNTPERGQPLYNQAVQFTADLCRVDSIVGIDEDDGQTEGSYDRMIAKVYCQSKILNAELLSAGLATIDTRFCNESEFAKEDWAQQYGCKQTVQQTQPPSTPPAPSPPPSPPSEEEKNCDPSYPDVCIPPPPPDLNCPNILYKNFRVLPPDPHRFDGDKDGIGCEK